MGERTTPTSGVDLNGMLAKEIDDYTNAMIYSMLGTCTNESKLQYQLEIAETSVLQLQNQVHDLESKLHIQTIKYEKAKEEASLNASALKQTIAVCEQLKGKRKKWMQRGLLLKSSLERRSQPIGELRARKRVKYGELRQPRLSAGHHTMTVCNNGNRIPRKEAVVTCEEPKVDERQSNQIEEKEPTRKIPLQELDPNAEDSNSMLTTSEPSINCIKSRKPPRMEVKQLNITENTCQQDHPKEEVEVLETHSNEIDRKLCSRKRLRWKLDLSAEASNYRLKTSMPSINSFKSLYSTRKKVKQLNMTEITHQQHVVKVELESDKRQTNQGDERHFNEVDEKHTTQRRPLQGLDLSAKDSNYGQKTSTPSIDCLKSTKSPRNFSIPFAYLLWICSLN